MRLNLFLICLQLGTLHARSQGQPPEDSARSKSVIAIMTEEKEILGSNSLLYQGLDYTGYDVQVKGSPFFLSDTMKIGSLYYDGIHFFSIPLRYDIVRDNLVIRDYEGGSSISLIRERTDSFLLGDHFFIYVSTDSTKPHSIPAGLYEQIYSGKSKVLLKWSKYVVMPIDAYQAAHFVQQTRYYIWNKGQYSKVGSKNEVMEVFADRKKQLRKYLRANKLRYKKNPERTMVRAALFYDQLN